LCSIILTLLGAPRIEEIQYAPVDGVLLYPFTREESVTCGHWGEGSLDYPYFGARREGDRLHGGIDLYTSGATADDGGGMVVRAIRSGRVLAVIENFYQRSSTGEMTQAILVDHGDFVACYGEIRGDPDDFGAPLRYAPGDSVSGGDTLGFVSGTGQLHFEMYSPGSVRRTRWYGPDRPEALLDPTEFIMAFYSAP
jgi:murein DD-endopeptidase MepM/ murein hydrolase activator NlpD